MLLFRVLPFEAPDAVFRLHVTGRAVSHTVPVAAARREIAGVLVGGGVQASHAETGHGGRDVEIRHDTEGARVRVLDVKVVARETRLHHSLQAVDKQLGIVLVGCGLKIRGSTTG